MERGRVSGEGRAGRGKADALRENIIHTDVAMYRFARLSLK